MSIGGVIQQNGVDCTTIPSNTPTPSITATPSQTPSNSCVPNYSFVDGTLYVCYGGGYNSYTVYRNTNTCWTGNQYYNAYSGATAGNPSNSVDPNPNWVSNGAAFCSGCVAYQPQIDNNPCSTSYNTTRNFNLGATSPCNYTPNWVNNGATFCSGCIAYQPQIDNNPCSPTAGQTRNVNLGATSPCNYSADYSSNVGTFYICSAGSVLSYTVYENTNGCYTGANRYYDGYHGPTPTNYSNDYPNTAPNWVTDYNYCGGPNNWDLYAHQTDQNPCSSQYGTSQNVLIEVHSATCGFASYAQSLAYDPYSAANACAGSPSTYYTTTVSMGSGIGIYIDPNCVNLASAGYYSDVNNGSVYYFNGTSTGATADC